MMRTLRYCCALGLALLLVSSTAFAGQLYLGGWLAGGGGTTVKAQYFDPLNTLKTQSLTGAGTGSIWGRHDNMPTGALWCLDLFHTFSGMPKTWTVYPQYVPPDPPFPPPWNTAECAYVYHHYKQFATDATKAAGIQLALWEISHEQYWRDNFAANTWNAEKTGLAYNGNSSDFSATLNLTSGKGLFATAILTDVKSNFSSWANPTPVLYYNPQQTQTDYAGMQGFVGEIPEPGSVVLLGLGLIGAAGLAWKRRKS